MRKTTALFCVSIFLVVGCGPLRPFEEFKTGGRTALTQWEYQEAISRLYQSQVLLNLIRMVEYGETPVHFEFSEIQATIIDETSAGMGISFDDSPTGRNIVGNVIIPTYDTPINFKPEFGGSRRVQLFAKAAPIVRKNWVYDWYYQIAQQFRADPSLRWYEASIAGTGRGVDLVREEPFGLHDRGSDIVVTYQKTRYVLKPQVKVEPGSQFYSFAPGKVLTPPRELGALTTILTLLSESRPESTLSNLPVSAIKPLGDSNRQYELYVPTSTAVAVVVDDFIARINDSSNTQLPYRLTMDQPDLIGRATFLVKPIEAQRRGDFIVFVVRYNTLPRRTGLATAVDAWNAVKSKNKDRASASLSFEAFELKDAELLIQPLMMVQHLSKRASPGPIVEDKDLLKGILEQLERLNSSQSTRPISGS